MTEDEIAAVARTVATPPQHLVVALTAEHAARQKAIRELTLDDLDLPNRRITLAGHDQRLGDLTHRALLTWLDHRRRTWPRTPNRHVLITGQAALGTGPVSAEYIKRDLLDPSVNLERVRTGRMLHEALTCGADPLHLALMFNIAHSTASQYATIARRLLGDCDDPAAPGGRK